MIPIQEPEDLGPLIPTRIKVIASLVLIGVILAYGLTRINFAPRIPPPQDPETVLKDTGYALPSCKGNSWPDTGRKLYYTRPTTYAFSFFDSGEHVTIEWDKAGHRFATIDEMSAFAEISRNDTEWRVLDSAAARRAIETIKRALTKEWLKHSAAKGGKRK